MGLDTLVEEHAFDRQGPTGGDEILRLPLDLIHLPPGRRRDDYSTVEIEAFARAIKATGGIENPVIVRPGGASSDGVYELVTGGLRLAAAHFLGWSAIPCRVRDLSVAAARVVGVVEDLAGKTERTLPLGWALLEAIEATGWKQTDFAALTNRHESQISESIRAARAIPEPMLTGVAGEHGVSRELARSLRREDLRKLRTVRDAATRRTLLGEALVRLRDQAPVETHNDTPPTLIRVAGGAIRVDASRIGQMRPLQIAMTALVTVWVLGRTWNEFAEVRRTSRGESEGIAQQDVAGHADGNRPAGR